jgi:hypothetical protein
LGLLQLPSFRLSQPINDLLIGLQSSQPVSLRWPSTKRVFILPNHNHNDGIAGDIVKEQSARLLNGLRRIAGILSTPFSTQPPCGKCGFRGGFVAHKVLWPELIAQWELDTQWARWMELREGSKCSWCNCNLRSSQLVHAILVAIARKAGRAPASLNGAFVSPAAAALRIAEINKAGNLHSALRRCGGLNYSEYGSVDPAIPSENLTSLSYADASLDIVITSDTLEHLPDLDRALEEIWRVLNIGGMHVFTVPIVTDRATRCRARLQDGKVQHLLPPSCHGSAYVGGDDLLVFNEFGADFVEFCAAKGYSVEQFVHTSNPAVQSFIATKVSSTGA